jgi:hypothetical protein
VKKVIRYPQQEQNFICRNSSLGLATKARACKVVGQDKKPGNERKCERMNLHTPKKDSTLGVGVLMDFQMFIEQLQKSELNGLRSYFIPLENY